MFYVYEWYDIDSGYIFYVGKGTKNRKNSISKRNIRFKEYLSTHNCENRIIDTFETEEDAFKAEHERIIALKSKGQCSCNLDEGGTGGVNFVWTNEMKQYKSEYNPMKDEHQKQRMSDNNPMKDTTIAQKVGMKKSKPVVINGVTYKGVKFASDALNVCEQTIIKWCRQGYDYNGNPCRYEHEKQVEYKFEQYNLGGSRRILYNGKEYPSAVWIAKELGKHYSTIHLWAKRGYDPNGTLCKYLDDEMDHIFVPPNKTPTAKPVEVNGITYPSVREAERQLGLYQGCIYFYLTGRRKNKKYVCRYVDELSKSANPTDEHN